MKKSRAIYAMHSLEPATIPCWTLYIKKNRALKKKRLRRKRLVFKVNGELLLKRNFEAITYF